MLDITRLYCGIQSPHEELRYSRSIGKQQLLKPVVVWNVTFRCNLKCIHCYADYTDGDRTEELSTDEVKHMIEDMAHLGVPAILCSGGEPLLRHDLLHTIQFAHEHGIRCILSTNGTLITKEVAEALLACGVQYVGVSIDGMEERHDRFRGVAGAFGKALTGIRNCMETGQKVGIRFTITRQNVGDIAALFDLLLAEGIDRVCFYHLVYSGRGRTIQEEDIAHDETRRVMELILSRTEDLCKSGVRKEVLTVDNHADAVYLYLRLKQDSPQRAAEAYALLKRNGGNRSGMGIACIDPFGTVHPDQFWMHYSCGNIRQRKFSAIWHDESEPLLRALRDRKRLLRGKCARCKYQDLCNGNLRVRAEAVYGDTWAEDPACYLTEEEITT